MNDYEKDMLLVMTRLVRICEVIIQSHDDDPLEDNTDTRRNLMLMVAVKKLCERDIEETYKQIETSIGQEDSEEMMRKLNELLDITIFNSVDTNFAKIKNEKV